MSPENCALGWQYSDRSDRQQGAATLFLHRRSAGRCYRLEREDRWLHDRRRRQLRPRQMKGIPHMRRQHRIRTIIGCLAALLVTRAAPAAPAVHVHGPALGDLMVDGVKG